MRWVTKKNFFVVLLLGGRMCLFLVVAIVVDKGVLFGGGNHIPVLQSANRGDFRVTLLLTCQNLSSFPIGKGINCLFVL